MEKTYNWSSVEEKWIKLWQEKKLFAAKIDKSKKPFVIVIPPPNITGALHMGHALNNTLQDIIIRYYKLKGENTYWVVGTDHGGIATQNVLEKKLKSQGILKSEIGREEFLKRMWEWYKECGSIILEQLKKLGCAIDFSKENIRFTMDEARTNAVIRAFIELWNEGLIYRGERMINWCTRCYTALSDIEVEYEEEKSKLWYIKYPIENSKDYITVATTRPETMLGDTAICVNPNDERYKDFIGKYAILPIVGRRIKIISDERVDKDFGTGAVKITPAHDPLDFDIAQTHKLEHIKVISDDGRMTNCPHKYEGLRVLKAREEIVKDLKENNFLIKEEDYTHSVGKCYRCQNHIEPLVSEQWFVKTKPLASLALKAIIDGKITFYPDKWKKQVVDWLNQIKDWCISRQIWWGHRIPVYYCLKCSNNGLVFNEKGEIIKVSFEKGAKPIVSQTQPKLCPDCGSSEIVQDPDVLDTWFSSALWPFSVFNWPKKTKDLDYFYPTSVLVTGYEILYLWVARMIMSGLFHMKEIPFSKVYVHGIVRDKHGQKMSKSKGNVIDPLDMMKKYGTDAMRFTIAINSLGGKDIPFSEDAIIGGRNFINKLYNASRFILMNVSGSKPYIVDKSKLDTYDKWILTRLYDVYRNYKKLMDEYLLSQGLDLVYGFVWDEFCDWYIEISKMYFNSQEEKIHKMSINLEVLKNVIKMLHPFIPFVTEEIHSYLKDYFNSSSQFILEEPFRFDEIINDENSVKDMKLLMDIVREVRTIRSEFAIHPGKEIDVIFLSDTILKDFIKRHENCIKHLAKIKNIDYSISNDGQKFIKGIVRNCQIYVRIDKEIDTVKQKNRILKEIDEIIKTTEKWKEMLSNTNFISKAPKSEVENLKKKIEENSQKIEKLKMMIKDL